MNKEHRKLNLARRMAQYVGRPYEAGATDCFSLVYQFIGERMALPDTFQGLTMQDYYPLFESDPVRAKQIMVEFCEAHLEEVQPAYAFAGDVLLVHLRKRNSSPFLAIHGGQTTLIAATKDRGVVAMPMQAFDILRGWRCQQRSL